MKKQKRVPITVKKNDISIRIPSNRFWLGISNRFWLGISKIAKLLKNLHFLNTIYDSLEVNAIE